MAIMIIIVSSDMEELKQYVNKYHKPPSVAIKQMYAEAVNKTLFYGYKKFYSNWNVKVPYALDLVQISLIYYRYVGGFFPIN
jgi:hypothetical protein